MSVEIVPATPALALAAPEFPPCWLTVADQPALPPPYPITAYDLGEALKVYEPPLYLTKRDEWRKSGLRSLRARRAKKESPLIRIAELLLQKLPEVRIDQHGRKVPAGVALWL